MKKNIILLACMVLGLSACYKSELEPLKGIFPAPTVVSGTSAATATSEKADGKRLFVVNLNEGGNQFRLNLVGDKYFRIDYPEHNLVRARAQLALFRDMMRHMEDMKAIIEDCGNINSAIK